MKRIRLFLLTVSRSYFDALMVRGHLDAFKKYVMYYFAFTISIICLYVIFWVKRDCSNFIWLSIGCLSMGITNQPTILTYSIELFHFLLRAGHRGLLDMEITPQKYHYLFRKIGLHVPNIRTRRHAG